MHTIRIDKVGLTIFLLIESRITVAPSELPNKIKDLFIKFNWSKNQMVSN